MGKSAWAVVLVVFGVPAIIAGVLVPKLRDSYTYEKVLQVAHDAYAIEQEVVEASVKQQAIKTGPRQPTSSMAREIVESIDVAPDGQITFTFKQDPGGKLLFAPLGLRGAKTEWRCWSEGMPEKAVPMWCRR
jgi:hypothetical protein